MHDIDKVKEAEREHGRWLSENDTLLVWGWGTPAGQRRAERRATLISTGAFLAPGMRVLEIGCGTGFFTEKFAKSGANILAVDISRELLDLARQRPLKAEQVSFLEAPFEDCDEHGPFDAIIGSSILHHLDCPLAFKKINALLRPGGRMSFCEPNMRNPQLWFTLRYRRLFNLISPDETAFYREEMEEMLAKAAFENISVVPFDWLHPKVPAALIPTVKMLEGVLEKCPGLRQYAGSLWITAQKPR